MGVSLGYTTLSPITAECHKQLLKLARQANKTYTWWCESIWLDDDLSDDGCAYGLTKLFCMIDDEDVDTYMAFLDIKHIVNVLRSASERLDLNWQLEIEGEAFGQIVRGSPDAELQNNIDSFLDVFPGDFERLRSRPRDEIIKEWSQR